MQETVRDLDPQYAQKYRQIKKISQSYYSSYASVFLVEDRQSKEVCVMKFAQKISNWQNQDKLNTLVNVRHNSLVKIIEFKDTIEYFIVVEE